MAPQRAGVSAFAASRRFMLWVVVEGPGARAGLEGGLDQLRPLSGCPRQALPNACALRLGPGRLGSAALAGGQRAPLLLMVPS